MERKEKVVEKVRDLGALLTQYAIETSPAGCEFPRSFNLLYAI